MHKWLEKKTDKLLDQAKEMSPKRIKSIRASYGLTQVAFSILGLNYRNGAKAN